MIRLALASWVTLTFTLVVAYFIQEKGDIDLVEAIFSFAIIAGVAVSAVCGIILLWVWALHG